MKFKKIIFAFIALIVLGSGAVYLSAADMSDFDRISPFDVRSLWLMRQVRYIIESYQVDADTKPASEEDLLHGAMRGMVAAWKDPYTRFVSPSQLKNEETEMEGRYGGLGMYVGERGGQILVISPMEDSPAEKAGLKPKDQIVQVNDESVVGWNSEQVVQKLRGEPGTKVTVWVVRDGEDKLLSFEITREIIKIESVRYNMLSDDVGYIKLTQFKQKTDEDVRNAVRDVIKQGAKGLVLDLRNNGGGLLDSSVKICSIFLNGGLVVETKGRSERANERYMADKARYMTDLPMAVLINGGSASASEIVAGALLDRNRAVLVGEKSFGKGSVQTLFPLTDGSGIYVTIARYYTPSGRMIDHVGLSPDIEVKGEPNKDVSLDAQLQRAKAEVVKKYKSAAESKNVKNIKNSSAKKVKRSKNV